MAEEFIWNGAYGARYSYRIYPISFTFREDDEGNYIFAKRGGSGWQAVYIGEGILNERVAAHIRDSCVTRQGATHIHAHLNDENARPRAEEADLLAEHTEAYEPTGCNKKPGG